MIRLYLVRHGIAAEPGEFSGSDFARPLTPKGRRRFRRAAKEFARLAEPVSLIVSSPLVRAVQTAELLAWTLKADAVEISSDLTPSGNADTLLRWVASRVSDGQGVALVGHDPGMSTLLARVAGLSAADAARVVFRKGCIVRVDVGALPSARPAQARWWMRPKARDLRQGLPLARPAGQAASPKRAATPKPAKE